jgi:hypothetical protein
MTRESNRPILVDFVKNLRKLHEANEKGMFHEEFDRLFPPSNETK